MLIKLNPPLGIKFQWSDSGSYQIDKLKQTVMNIPNGYNPFSCTDFAIYVPEDSAVHFMPRVGKLFWERAYVPIIIGDGITDYIQQNNTRVHRPLKHEYRDLEAKLLLSVLQKGR